MCMINLRDKARVLTAYSVAFDESTDKTDNVQLAISIKVTEELLSLTN